MTTYTTATAVEKLTAWLRTKPGIPMDAIQAARWFDKEHGTHTDWHVASYAFGDIEAGGNARRTGYASDGFVEYVITLEAQP